jgi:hypothetical protein
MDPALCVTQAENRQFSKAALLHFATVVVPVVSIQLKLAQRVPGKGRRGDSVMTALAAISGPDCFQNRKYARETAIHIVLSRAFRSSAVALGGI